MEATDQTEEKVQARYIEKGDIIQYPSSWLVTHKSTDPVLPLEGEVLAVYTDSTYIAFKTASGHIQGMNRQKHVTRVKRSELSASERMPLKQLPGSTMVKCGSHYVSID